MFFTRCPRCKRNVEVADDLAVSVRCPACDRKIALRESPEEQERRHEKAAREAHKKKGPPPNIWLEMLPILIAVPLSLLILMVTCVVPHFVVIVFLGGIAVSFIGMGKGCMLAAHDGNYVSFDYVGILGWFDVVLIVLFVILFPLFCLVSLVYVQVYLLLWEIVLIGCAIKNPKVYLPWVGLQAFGWAVVFLGFFCGLVGEMVWSGLR